MSRLRQAELSPLEVSLRPSESPDRMLRRFIRKVREDGVLREARQRGSFMKPSAQRRFRRKTAQS